MKSTISTNTNFSRSGLTLLILSALFFGASQFLLRDLEPDIPEFPVNLSKVGEYSWNFKSKWAVYYEIRLDTERSLDLQEQNCLLGIENLVPERCENHLPDLLLSWRIEAGANIVASGGFDDIGKGYWGLNMGKILGSFPASEETDYHVIVQIRKPSHQLQQTNPRIKIKIRSEDLKWTYVWIGILSQAAVFCLLLAIISFLITFSRKLKAHHSSK